MNGPPLITHLISIQRLVCIEVKTYTRETNNKIVMIDETTVSVVKVSMLRLLVERTLEVVNCMARL